MPWDLEEDEQDNSRCWFELHVPTRCNLWATSFAGDGCPPYTLHNLRDDGEIIRKHILHIEESLNSDNEEDIGYNAKNVSILVSLHEQLQALRARWELLQNPTLQELWNTTSVQESFEPSKVILLIYIFKIMNGFIINIPCNDGLIGRLHVTVDEHYMFMIMI